MAIISEPAVIRPGLIAAHQQMMLPRCPGHLSFLLGEASRQSPARWMLPTPKCGDHLQRIETPDEMEMARAQNARRGHIVSASGTPFSPALLAKRGLRGAFMEGSRA